MSLFDLLIGRPIATTEERAEHIGPIAGIPVFGLDALSSAAYGPEAALTLLIPLGLAGIAHIVPISSPSSACWLLSSSLTCRPSTPTLTAAAVTRSHQRTLARTPVCSPLPR
jgi:hypothetical protein